MDRLCTHRVSVAILLLLVNLLATSSGETVYINDGETLEGYLCSPSGTIAPNTILFLNNSYLEIEHYGFCLVENTSDITIAAAPELGENGININLIQSRWIFFNITNLTITSITLLTDTPAADIPPSALRYINDSNQFLYYDKDTEMGILFNHCSNVTIQNLNFNASSWLPIIGVNLCGYSCINNPDNGHMLFYYLDTVISSEQCDLHVQSSPSISDGGLYDITLLNSRPKQMPVKKFDSFALILTQQNSNADVLITLLPGLGIALILFVNSLTDSHVEIQGLGYEYCITGPIDHDSPLLSVYFYETPNFSGSVDHIIQSLQVENTSLQALQVFRSPGQLSHQIALVNVSLCDKHIFIQFPVLIMATPNNEGNLHVNMKNMHFQHPRFLDDDFLTEDSVYFANIRNITMTGTNFFNASNGGSVINVISSNLTLTGDLTVNNGNAFQGGGIRLDDSSTLFLKEPLRAQFTNDTAYQGSAIYAAPNHLELLQTRSLIQILPNQVYSWHNISNINIALHFENNLDKSLNRIVSMHAPHLSFLYDQTSLFYHKSWDEPHSQYAYTTLFDAMFKADDIDKYTSLSNGICMQVRKEPWNCTYIDLYYHNIVEKKTFAQHLLQIHTYPGEEIFSILHTGNQDFSIIRCETHLIVKSEYYSLTRSTSTLLFRFFNKKGEDLCFVILVLNSEIQDLMAPFIQVHMNATCPPGFSLNDKGYCDCVSALQSHLYKCNISSRIFTSPEGYWTGYEEHNTTNTTSYTITFSSHCPPDYCNQSFRNFFLDNSIAYSSCLNNRSGVMCGQCKRENYTVHSAIFGSDACSDDCTDIYLLTLLAYALAGLLLVAVLFALKLTVAVGTINGVIFYANILGLSMDKLTEGHHGPHLIFFRIVISLLNLDLGFPLCFYKGMTTTDKVGLQFVFPMYIWGIVIGMIIVARYSIRFANCISNSAIPVLATLFYLSFPKLLRAVIDIVTYSTINLVVFDPDKNNSYTNREQTVCFYSGEEYGKGVHGFYMFLASVFILFFLLYTILTTFSSCFMRFKLVNKFKPLIDAYGGPFKDKWRFWFGLRLWITVLIFSVSGTLRGTDYNGSFVINLIILSIFILIQSFVRPFKSRLILLMDLFFMINYWLIILFYLVFKSNFIDAYIFLLSAAILVLVLVLLSHFCYVCIYSKNPGVFLQVKTKFNRRFAGYERIEDQVNEEEANIQIFNAAEEREQVFDTY